MKFILIILSLFIATSAFAGTAKLSWEANTESDLAGYKIHMGDITGTYTRVIDVALTPTPLNPVIVLNDVKVLCGENKSAFFALTAYDTAGNESDFSNEVFKLFDPAPCAPTLTQILAAVKSMLQDLTIESKLVFPITAP